MRDSFPGERRALSPALHRRSPERSTAAAMLCVAATERDRSYADRNAREGYGCSGAPDHGGYFCAVFIYSILCPVTGGRFDRKQQMCGLHEPLLTVR
jgi:hypothetical protein